MQKPTLVIMAAGLGSRYGGLKQIDPVGPFGELIIDYSIYDAVKAGFEKVVFIIKEEIEKDFKEIIGNRIEKIVKTEYAYQRIDNLPAGFSVPAGRTKPFGTAHAILSCKGIVNESFAAINADDYYGAEAFRLLFDYLSRPKKGELYPFCMIGYRLSNTVTDYGHVARGICSVDKGGHLTRIVERTRIEKRGESIRFTENGTDWTELDKDSIVSMNCWGFSPEIIGEIERLFIDFLSDENTDPLKSEFYLPFVVDTLIKEKKAEVKVLGTTDKWYGVTYKEDKATVVSAIAKLIEEGIYPERLWKND